MSHYSGDNFHHGNGGHHHSGHSHNYSGGNSHRNISYSGNGQQSQPSQFHSSQPLPPTEGSPITIHYTWIIEPHEFRVWFNGHGRRNAYSHHFGPDGAYKFRLMLSYNKEMNKDVLLVQQVQNHGSTSFEDTDWGAPPQLVDQRQPMNNEKILPKDYLVTYNITVVTGGNTGNRYSSERPARMLGTRPTLMWRTNDMFPNADNYLDTEKVVRIELVLRKVKHQPNHMSSFNSKPTSNLATAPSFLSGSFESIPQTNLASAVNAQPFTPAVSSIDNNNAPSAHDEIKEDEEEGHDEEVEEEEEDGDDSVDEHEKTINSLLNETLDQPADLSSGSISQHGDTDENGDEEKSKIDAEPTLDASLDQSGWQEDEHDEKNVQESKNSTEDVIVLDKPSPSPAEQDKLNAMVTLSDDSLVHDSPKIVSNRGGNARRGGFKRRNDSGASSLRNQINQNVGAGNGAFVANSGGDSFRGGRHGNSNKRSSLTITSKVDIQQSPSSKSTGTTTATSIDYKSGNLAKSLAGLRTSPILSDVTIVTAGGHEHKAHKNLLAARSPVFAAMFATMVPEMDFGPIGRFQLNEAASEDAVKAMLDWIYTDDVSKVQKHAHELIDLATKYELQALIEACNKFTTITVDSACKTLLTAHNKGLPALKEKAVSFINAHAAEVATTPGWTQLKTNAALMTELYEQIMNIN